MSQVECGSLKKVNEVDGVEFKGQVMLGSRLNGQIILMKVTREAKTDDAPDYKVFYQARGNPTAIPCGSAWHKHHNNVGDFLTLTIDDPDWTSILNLAAFPPDKGDQWRIVWSRPRQRPQAAAA